MRTLSYRILQIVAVVLVVATCTMAELLDEGRVSVVLLPGNYDSRASIGNHRFSFRVGNNSNETREIALVMMRGRTTVRRSAKIPAGESVIMSMVFPRGSKWNHWHGSDCLLDVFVNGKGFRAQTTSSSLNSSSSYNDYECALCSTSVPSEEFEAIYGNFGAHNGLYNFVRSPMGVNEWGRDVEDYMNYRVIWVTAEEIIPPDVEKALRKWVFNGGKLIRCVMGEWPSSLPYNFPTDRPEKFCHEERYGFGSIFTFKPYIGRTAGVADYARKVRDRGQEFWRHPDKAPSCVYVPKHLGEKLTNPPARVLTLDFASGNEILFMGEPDVPIFMLVLIMTVFVLLVGPLNYVLLMKRRRTALMVVTMPLISLAFCILVFTFVAISSGFALRGKIFGYTYLDQNDRVASTYAHVSLLAPNMTRRNLVFDTNDNVTLFHNASFEVLDKPGMEIDSGYIPVRTALNYTVNRCESTNERLRVNRTDGGLEIVNGLSAPLSHFLYNDGDGSLHYAENVPEGKRVSLTALPKNEYSAPIAASAVKSAAMRDGFLFNSRQIVFFDLFKPIADGKDVKKSFLNAMSGKLPPGMFVALTDKPMFYKSGLVPSKGEVHHLIMGNMENKQ